MIKTRERLWMKRKTSQMISGKVENGSIYRTIVKTQIRKFAFYWLGSRHIHHPTRVVW